MSIKPNRLRITIIFFLFFVNLTLYSQLKIVSPYSRFGLGDLSINNSAWNFSMAGLGIGVRGTNHVNYTNPAAYSGFDSLSFVFNGGFSGQTTTLKSNYQETHRNYGTLGYLLFGMPANRWWKTTIGLVPFSEVGYTVVNYEKYPESGTIARLYSGSGGISRLFWGNSFRIKQKFSIGVNISYLFGSMVRGATVYFPDSAHAMNIRENFYVTMSDIYLDFGAQYRTRIKNDLFVTLGAVFSPTMNMASQTDILATTFLLSSSGSESTRDTLVKEKEYKGQVVIPMLAGGGISFEKPNQWVVGVDYKWQNWENYEAFGHSDSLVNSWQVTVGGEIIPDIDKFNNYLARIHYRLGFNYGRTYLNLRGQDLNAYAISFGFGFPLRGMKTMVDLGGQFGVRGTTEANLIRESYFKLIVGFSIYERWFVKRKFY